MILLDDYADTCSAVVVLIGTKWEDWYPYKVGYATPFWSWVHWN